MQLAGPLFNMGTFFREVEQSNVDLEDLVDMLKKKPKIIEAENAVQYDDFAQSDSYIEFDKVTFGHERDDETIDNLFKDFSLKIKKGTTNAIVGPSGFGKTTLLYLMFRIYDPVTGTVRVNGQDLKNLSLESFRKHMCVIPQNGILFNDSLLFNLKYGN
jgi:ABC-type multidrug transport system fused ATPase/permease subunit